MIELDRNADTFPVGMSGTPFEEVYRALRIVAATVWNVDPLAYRAGMAWGWYALHDTAALAGFRDVVTAALISAVAPMVKDTQTDAELAEYLRQWRSYIPTFPKLQALYALFGAVVDIQPISDPESQSVLPVDDMRLAFYIRIESIDFSRSLSLAEAREIAVRATPLGSRPYPYYALETRIPCAALPAPVGIYIRVENWELARDVTPVVVLPTVTLANAYVYNASESSTMTIYAGSSFMAKDASGNSIVYDASLLYKAYASYSGISDPIWFNNGWTPIESSGLLAIMNNASSGSRTVHHVCYAACSDYTATVITVYDSSNNAFNAFKFTVSGTDYYYVLDGTQTDWTDDLAGIGYSLTPTTVKAWFNDDKTPKVLTSGTIGILKDSSGNHLVYDNTKTYHIYRTVNSSGDNLPNVTLQIDSGYYLGYKNETGQTLYDAVYVEYYTT